MTRAELIDRLACLRTDLPYHQVERAVKTLLEHMAATLAQAERIEIRGFASFCLHHRPPRTGRNPKTGEAVQVPVKHTVHFKPGKDLKARVDHAQCQDRGSLLSKRAIGD